MADHRLIPGRIIIVPDCLDPQGRNPKDRRFVVISPQDDIAAGEDIFAVAISGDLPKADDPAVAIPWRGSPPHPQTLCVKRCWAWCDWVAEIPQTDITIFSGVVPNRVLDQIMEIVEGMEG